VANFKRGLKRYGQVSALIFTSLFANVFAQGKNISAFFKTAPHVWHNDSLQSPLRPRLYLNGRWQAASKKPPLHGEVELPGTLSFEGEIELQRSFRLDSTLMNRPLRLVMHGAHYATQVKINNEIIGSHEGGYTPFVLDLRPERLFVDKENLLNITVSNVLSPLQTLPPKQRPYGWLNEGGIGREIYLEALPGIFIEKAKLTYSLEQTTATLNMVVEVRSQNKLETDEKNGVTAILEIWEPDRLKKLAASAPSPLTANGRAQQTLTLTCQLNQPSLWSPATPNLYAMHLALFRKNILIDEIWENLGLRQLKIVDRQFYLNGEPFVVRGVNWVEDYGRHSALLDSTKLRKLLFDVKDLGANTIRVIGHPPHPLLPAWCDRAGLFLLEELPLYYLTDVHFRQPQFFDLAQAQASELISRDQYHPSVLGWGVAVNSALESPEAKNAAGNLCQMLRQFDQRPIYAVAPFKRLSDWDPLVDFILPDMFETENANDINTAIASSRNAVAPIIGFWLRDELGATGRTATGAGDNAEQRQAERLNEVFKKFDDMPNLAGYFVQALIDWPAERPALVLGPTAGKAQFDSASMRSNAMPKDIFVHLAGLMSQEGKRRMAYRLVQAFNRDDRRPLQITRSAAAVYPQEYPIVGLAVVLVLLFFINRDRRLRSNLQRIFVHPHGFYVDVNENRKVPPFLSTLLGLAEGCIVAILLSGFCYANRTSLVFDQFLNLLIADPAWKARLVWLIWHPSWFIAVVTASLFAIGLLTAVLMRILGFFLGRSIPTIQYFTFVFWAAANVLVLGIIAPFFYRLLLYKDFSAPLLFLVVAILLWLVGRYFRGMRVVYTMSIPRTIIIFGILVGGLIISLVLYYQRTEAIFEYMKYYWGMLRVDM
jgi:hypothetical protein